MNTVRFDKITKRFPGVVALDDVTLDIAQGSCHALCGENGAGKSTLAKVLAGIYKPDEGQLHLHGEPVKFASPRDALAAGVAIVHQELSFCDNLSIAENLCLSDLPARGGIVSRAAMHARAHAMLKEIGVDFDTARVVGDLSIAQQQMVQIASAVGSGARIIIFDEPTSSLGHSEAEEFFALMQRLRERGITCIYVSHRLPEIFQLCDTVSVLRDGKHIATRAREDWTEAALVQTMIGRPLEEYLPQHLDVALGEEMLRLERLSATGQFENISFSVRAGEIVGLAGLVGAGRTEVAQALFGLRPDVRGEVHVRGHVVKARSPRAAIASGIALVPEDRKRQGLVLSESALHNTTLPILERVSRVRFIRRWFERDLVHAFFQQLRVSVRSVDAPVAGLSGGNQQKVVLARWLAAESRILILDEPTRGVDVGAKAEIHRRIDELARGGHAILLISSELPELLSLSTRVVVLREGRVATELSREQATQDVILKHMTQLPYDSDERSAF